MLKIPVCVSHGGWYKMMSSFVKTLGWGPPGTHASQLPAESLPLGLQWSAWDSLWSLIQTHCRRVPPRARCMLDPTHFFIFDGEVVRWLHISDLGWYNQHIKLILYYIICQISL